jgi:hypothetical protein
MRIGPWLWVVLALFAVWQAGAAHAQSDAAQERAFRAEMERRFSEAVPGIEMRGEEPLTIELAGGPYDGARINLQRIYLYCQTASAADCEGEKIAFVEGMRSAFQDQPERGAANLRIIVRDTQYVASITSAHRRSGRAAEPIPFVIRPIGDDLYAILVFDAPTTIAIATRDALGPLNLTADQAWTMALEQTFAILPRLRRGDNADALNVVETREYGASLLLASDMWTELSAIYGPTMAMTVVTDQFVIFGRIADGDQLTGMAQAAAEDCAAASRCISPHVYRWRNGRWVRTR